MNNQYWQNHNILMKAALILLFSLGLSKTVVCQNDTSSAGFLFGSVGVIGDFKDRGGFVVGLNTHNDKNYFSIEYYQNEEFLVGFPFDDPKVNYVTDIKNLSLVYGFSFGNKHFKLIPNAGVSYGEGRWRNNNVDTKIVPGFLISNTYYTYHYEKFDYVGVNLGLNVYWMPSKYIGLGLRLFENLHKHPDNGISLSIIAGKLRN